MQDAAVLLIPARIKRGEYHLEYVRKALAVPVYLRRVKHEPRVLYGVAGVNVIAQSLGEEPVIRRYHLMYKVTAVHEVAERVA